MAAAESASASLGPRFAPEDPTLPKPWTGLIDGSTGLLYYWNPETNVTQYERPAAPAPAPPLPPGPPPSALTPKVAPMPAVHTLPPNGIIQQQLGQQILQQPSQQIPQQPQQPLTSQQLPFQQPSQQISLQHSQQMAFPETQVQNQQAQQFQRQTQQFSQQLQQVSYLQGQLMPHLQGQEQQGLQMPHQQRQQLQGPQMPNQQGQQPQGPQIPYKQGRQPEGSQIAGQQEQQLQGSQFSHQPGLQSVGPPVVHHQGQQPQGPQVMNQPEQQVQRPQPHGQQPGHHQGLRIGFSRSEDAGLHEGKQAGFNSSPAHQAGPISSNHHLTGGSPQVQVPYSGSHPLHSEQQLGGLSSVSAQQTGPALAQLQQEGIDTFHWQQRMGTPMGSNQMGHSVMRPPMGLKMEHEEDQRGRARDEFYLSCSGGGPMIPSEQPKLAALPHARNQQDMRMGSIDSQFGPQGHAAGLNMVPPYAMPNMYNHPPFPNAGPMRPPLRMFGSPDFPNMSAADAYRQHHEVTAVGDDVPAPFMTFESTGFPQEILREMQFAGFLSPTPIQAQTWPVALQNRDIVAIAKTGSGKTLGYLIPAFIHLRRCRNNPQIGPTVLVLAPTRELATQIQGEALKFGRSSRISCTCLYGGAPKGPQLKELERGTDIVVATPGRLNDILEMGKINFRQVSFLVLDEADRMLDMGFEPQIRRIVNEIPPRRQTLMYTATWPKEVRKIAADLLVNPVQVNIGGVDELVANKSITQYVEVVPQMDKQRRLEQILKAHERGSKIIIFCSTKRLCDQLARSIGRPFGAVAIHGDKSQDERDRVLNEFRAGRAPILVATDVAARGLNIKDIRVVINYDFPTGIEDYVHRIGRTGRAGATGVSYTFFSDQDWKYAADLVKVLEGADQPVPPELHEMAARGGPLYQRGGEQGGMSRWDSGGGRWDTGGGRGGMRDGRSGRGMMRDGGGGRAMMRDGGGGRGMMRDGGSVRGMVRDGPGGSFGGRGGGRNDFHGGRGGRGRGFGGPGGWGRPDRGPYDRFNHPDGRGRFEKRRPIGDRSREGGYSRSPDRVRTWGHDRSGSRSRSRSRSRSSSHSRSPSWSRSRSRSRSRGQSHSRSWSRSPSHSYDRFERPRTRVSGFDVPLAAPVQEAPPPATTEMDALPVPVLAPGYEAPMVSSFDAGQMSPMSPGQDNGSFPTGSESEIPEQFPRLSDLPDTGSDPGLHHPSVV